MGYFEETPTYKLWIDFIDITTPLFSFLVAKGYAFKNIVCAREGVIHTYANADVVVEIQFNHEYRFLKFSVTKIDSGELVYRNVCNLAELEQAGKIFNRNVFEAVIKAWKAGLVTQVAL